VCGLAALLVAPIILGPLGITFGFIGKSKGDRVDRHDDRRDRHRGRPDVGRTRRLT
jgi:hypothetical protein